MKFNTIVVPTFDSSIRFGPGIDKSTIFINGAKIHNRPKSRLDLPLLLNSDSKYHIDTSSISNVGELSNWPDWLSYSVSCILNHEIIAIPTETVYGLAANALSEKAVRKIYEAKGRPSDNPLIVHVSSLEMLISLYKPSNSNLSEFKEISLSKNTAKNPDYWDADVLPKIYKQLVEIFWPGPLTIVLPRPKCIPSIVLGNSQVNNTVAFRLPSHPVARAIIECCGVPIAAPSANSSGLPSPTLAEHVFKDLNGLIPLIIDSGSSKIGLESTVVDAISEKLPTKDLGVLDRSTLTDSNQFKSKPFYFEQIDEFNSYIDPSNNHVIAKVPCILRPGGISFEQITEMANSHNSKLGSATNIGGTAPASKYFSNDSSNLWNDLIVYGKNFSDAGIETAPTTPGMKYKHYSPKAKVSLLIPNQNTNVDSNNNSGVDKLLPSLLIRKKTIEYILNLYHDFCNRSVIKTPLKSSIDPSSNHSIANIPNPRFLIGLVCIASDSKWLNLPEESFSVETFDTSSPSFNTLSKFSGISSISAEHMNTIYQLPKLSDNNLKSKSINHSENQKVKVIVFLVSSKYTLGSNMFNLLRLADEFGVNEIIVEGVSDDGEGMAIMNRLRKASTNHIFVG
ncbi:Threonylcarbamoyl-AMP synthase [Smittium mucronatum]|uniref:Threonylcarbamoyl-AMP synthase n=1 Tax=Smittium mucronatum TaxID=133383 RepID=A0A1R0H248_9FUNG|nr:Threonylcarbamoyl-AMP synthase [Smittium mucronatum]